MKKVIFMQILFVLIPILGFTQSQESFDYVSKFHEDVAAVKKGNQWGFINGNGNIVIDFRGDLVLTETEDGMYPVFKNDRCLISEIKNDIPYFGYIDKSGKTVIEPQFLKALNFNYNAAFALKLVTEVIGTNEILNKRMVYHKYFEVIIDTNGNVKDYLSEPINIILDKKHIKKPLKITSKFISDQLIATMNKDGKWNIRKYEQ
ncbi:WG repeat-containing protein [Confluentibacter lentus]|uniref:WG repeat-containing protein n=1 Tax=Confluentibacter lentus TaxID=1699412 RepID=UPI000C28647E|nr:WG repeat-containing protein [Confluentibacter lentus]